MNLKQSNDFGKSNNAAVKKQLQEANPFVSRAQIRKNVLRARFFLYPLGKMTAMWMFLTCSFLLGSTPEPCAESHRSQLSIFGDFSTTEVLRLHRHEQEKPRTMCLSCNHEQRRLSQPENICHINYLAQRKCSQ